MVLINVRLRIVGLYFNETVSIEDRPDLTVRDVMDEYIRLHPNLSVPGGLEYVRYPDVAIPLKARDYVRTISYHFNSVYNFNADDSGAVPPDGNSLGNRLRTAGIYTLSEDLEDNFPDINKVGLAWQYYVVSKGGVVKSRTREERDFQAFGELEVPINKPKYDFKDGDTIIWRLVAIAREPNYIYV